MLWCWVLKHGVLTEYFLETGRGGYRSWERTARPAVASGAILQLQGCPGKGMPTVPVCPSQPPHQQSHTLTQLCVQVGGLSLNGSPLGEGQKFSWADLVGGALDYTPKPGSDPAAALPDGTVDSFVVHVDYDGAPAADMAFAMASTKGEGYFVMRGRRACSGPCSGSVCCPESPLHLLELAELDRSACVYSTQSVWQRTLSMARSPQIRVNAPSAFCRCRRLPGFRPGDGRDCQRSPDCRHLSGNQVAIRKCQFLSRGENPENMRIPLYPTLILGSAALPQTQPLHGTALCAHLLTLLSRPLLQVVVGDSIQAVCGGSVCYDEVYLIPFQQVCC